MQGFSYYISNRDDGNISYYAGTGDVLVNRKLLLQKLGVSIDRLVVMNQCHSSDFFVVSNNHKGKGAFSGDDAINGVDALITQEKSIVLLAQGADCPLLVAYNRKKEVLSVIHSGWKGTQKEIIPNVLSYMAKSMECNNNYTEVVISPFAKSCCYEVGVDFRSSFPEYTNAFLLRDGHLYFDLSFVIKEQLLSCGIFEENIHFEIGCTMCCDSYFSFRKEGQKAGRFGLLAWMNS